MDYIVRLGHNNGDVEYQIKARDEYEAICHAETVFRTVYKYTHGVNYRGGITLSVRRPGMNEAAKRGEEKAQV